MITGGNATVYVSDMNRAVAFYVDTLGLKLLQRFGDHWSSVAAGSSLVIGLHPKSAHGPAPGTSGSISIGLTIDEPIAEVVQRLTGKGVQFRGPIVNDPKAGIALAFFGDPDGNDLYLCQTTQAW
jgi:catechol 2,3-dioxygenase-like lactoylglutathione lyase family enzyme